MAEVVSPEAPLLPWPRILRQNWMNLSFLHWAVEPAPNEHPVWALRRAELIDFEDDGLLASVGLGDLGTRPRIT